MRSLWLVVAVLASGCMAGTPPPPATDDGAPCAPVVVHQVTEMVAGGHAVRVPPTPVGGEGSLDSGRRVTLGLAEDPDRLERLEVTLNWTAQAGSSDTLRASIRPVDGFEDLAGPVEGPSPLTLTLGPGVLQGTQYDVRVGAPWNATPVGGVLLVEQGVTIAVSQTYLCAPNA